MIAKLVIASRVSGVAIQGRQWPWTASSLLSSQ
jgi:hypothetical protein